MNLITDGWIPVVTDEGQTRLVGLKELYEKSRDFRDLSLNPPQRISVMRLLICITQAALDGPENEAGWLKCEDRIIPESLKYLEKHKDKFNLYGEKPFLQVAGLTANEMKSLDKLEFSSPSASTLFEHEAAGEINRNRNNIWKALNLLTLLNFNTTGKVGQAIWSGDNNNFSTYPTPCIGHAHVFIKGENILKSIFCNLITKDEASKLPNGKWGIPVWDCFPKSDNDSKALDNASKTYLGRLVPFSRLILLKEEDTECIIGPTPKSIEFTGPPAYREPSTTIILSKKNEPYCMKINSDKHIWRDLGSVLLISATVNNGAPLTIRKINKLASIIQDHFVDLWVGGLELGEQAAKLNDMVEWNLSIPLSFFQDGTLNVYSDGVTLADNGANKLDRTVSKYCSIMEMPSLKPKARIHFWQSLDNNYRILIDSVADGESLDEWNKQIYSAMRSAFEYACPHETPRQIQAYAQALLTLKQAATNG